MADTRIEELRSLLPRCMLPDWVRLGSRLVRLLRDNHHQSRHDDVVERLLTQARASVELRELRRTNAPQVSYPPDLPITARKNEIVEAIRTHQVVVIAGETGSGKTTQIPKMCLEAGLGIEARIGCTQPRRVAALSISKRIAEELNVAWGREVGCKIRFDDHSSPETFIKLMTDGILLAETQGDPLLSDYNALILDEAHERSLNIDFLLGYLKGLLAKRPELKLVITSATIDTQAFSKAFNDAPIIEVSGRLYPVQLLYRPLDSASEEAGDLTYIDAAVRACEEVLCSPGDGDVLVFMPSERDIRETAEQLKAGYGQDAEIIPLFGRLSAGDQQRVFAPQARRKIVVATNIAETSLTIPGIRYVIDSGLARLSRYNPRTRTRRLPIEPVSQSSANQRKGRAGRVREGICIRLFSEEDFQERPAFTQPEIQRANLAEVILRMKAFRLGDIESFPFLNPPTPAAIQGGYRLLQELGALDAERQLTALGRDLARLPIDPTLGRMLLQSQHEQATEELLIIAAGLTVQDPRERPMDQKEAANAAHKRFVDPKSDFLTLLNLWNTVHEEWEKLPTQNQRRKFCKKHFLSYLRMREWEDLHAQLADALEALELLQLNRHAASYDAIHRSVLAGLLGHVANRVERNLYKGLGNRQLTVFPGSALYERVEKQPRKAASRGKTPPKPAASNQPEWVVAGEIVETSQLFVRTLAGIDPLWILDLAPQLCEVKHTNPRWEVQAGQVMADEKISFCGMEIRSQKVAYGNLNLEEATRIFLRSALVEENLLPEPPRGRREEDESRMSASQLLAAASEPERKLPAAYAFVEFNRKVRHKIETWQTRARRHDLGDLDEALYQFYAERIHSVSSLFELNRFLRGLTNQDSLHVKESDLIGSQDLSFDSAAFPDAVALGGQQVPLSYAYKPGEEADGVTLQLGGELARSLTQATVDWAVPGLREAQVSELLRALPKALRKQLMPFPPKVAEIVGELQPSGHSLVQDLSRFIFKRYGVEIPPSAWPSEALPQHLRPRVEILDTHRKPVRAGRDLSVLCQDLEKAPRKPAGEPPAWTQAASRWEHFGLTGWTFGDLPEQVVVEANTTPPLIGWPGLELEEGAVNLRLFRARDLARQHSLPAVHRLIELTLQKDLAWFQKDLRSLSTLQPVLGKLCPLEGLQSMAFEHLKRALFPTTALTPLSQAQFQAAVEQVRCHLPGLCLQFKDLLETILKVRQEILRRYGVTPAAAPQRLRTLSDLSQLGATAVKAPQTNWTAAELNSLLPANFLETIPYAQLGHLPRYLKALLIRAERAALNPAKDKERASRLSRYVEAQKKYQATPPRSETGQSLAQTYRWMVEEFKVSLFAQELGTAQPVSEKRLDQLLEELRMA